MAVMDMIERGDHPSSANLNEDTVNRGSASVVGNQIDKENNSHNSPAASGKTIATPNFGRFSKGPIPEKGSGQDRFRQMMMNIPGAGMPTSGPFANQTMGPPQGQAPTIPMTHYSVGHNGLIGPTSTVYTPVPDASRMASIQPQIRNQSTNPQITAASGDQRPTITAILSAECQKRRFNPQFTEWMTPEGRNMCSVNLNGVILHDSRTFSSALEAKQSLAKRAVAEVKKLPVDPNNPNKAAEKAEMFEKAAKAAKNTTWNKVKSEVPQGAHAHNGGIFKIKRRDDCPSYYVPPPIAAQGRGFPSHYTADPRTQQSEAANLINRIQALYKRPSYGTSSFILTDPLASRAFLEGFALGGKLHESSESNQYIEQARPRSPQVTFDRLYGRYQQHDRERSPAAGHGRGNHRERSPIRRRLSWGGQERI